MSHPDGCVSLGMLGRTINQYRVIEEIGRGSFGIVYKAEDTTLPRFVALKFPSDQISADRAALDRFRREAAAASSLSHQNICVIHGVGEFEEKPFIVMEFLNGQTLRKLISGKPLPLDRTIDLGIQIADGLAAAHEKPIIHRDIKPGNIFVTDRDQIKILDFGLAKVMPIKKEI